MAQTPLQIFGDPKQRRIERCFDGCQCYYCDLMDVLEWDDFCVWYLMEDQYNPVRYYAWKWNFLCTSYDIYINAWIDRVFEQNPKMLEQVKSGKKIEKAVGFLMGRIMAISKDKAHPETTMRMLRERLGLNAK